MNGVTYGEEKEKEYNFGYRCYYCFLCNIVCSCALHL